LRNLVLSLDIEALRFSFFHNQVLSFFLYM